MADDPALRALDRLVGTWEISGGAQGTVSDEWLEGEHFLVQHVDLEQAGHRVKGIEIIGRLRRCHAQQAWVYPGGGKKKG